ncbi:YhfT family protein [Lacrimispora sp.]|uniref:YhfT family protein n=1 Tax=Lacrimispora sp. TaxID=2719234 RepID=UPI00289B010C|nr:YhfT family protein [Lacrimispora sp.]
MKYIVIALIGALASVLSNQGIAVFNDGFRPIVGQYFNGEINRKELAAMSFAISFGLVIGFGIPTSIAASIILIHCLLLTTDIIGSFCNNSRNGMILSAVIGAAYGLAILAGLEFVVKLFSYMPYNFTSDLGSVSGYITVAFAVFPAVGIAYQHGFKKGMTTGIVTLLVYFLVKKFGTFTIGAGKVSLNAEGMAMLAGMIMMLFYAAQQKGTEHANEVLTQGFEGNILRIRKNWLLLAVMGGLIAAGTSLSIIAGDPASLALLANQEYSNAGLTALARAIGFIPLVFTTAIVTGVYGAAGCTFVFVVGLFLHGNPVFAFVIGFAVMVAEIFLINIFAKYMDKFPGVKDMGEYVRTSMNKVLEISLLAGGIVAAEKMAASSSGYTGIGALFVIGGFLLNKKAKKPIVDLAVGPVACIVFGVLLNLLLIIGLIAVPAAK